MDWIARDLCQPEAGQRFFAGKHTYELQGKLGDGAVGLVRRAVCIEDGRQVAVKFLAPDPKYIDPSSFGDVADRFRREGERGANLRHENLVEILAYVENHDGEAFVSQAVRNPFLVMEFIRGRTLEAHIKNLETNRPPSCINRQTLKIALGVTSALQHLHERKIVHRDVKPGNIFVSSTDNESVPGVVKLGDFGVTKWGDFRAAMTTGALTMSHQQGLGTIKYMSAEQAIRPKEVTVRSDMYSLGITLFELFSGRLLPSPHHAFEIRSARAMRTSITGKLQAVNVRGLSRFEEGIFEPILDMFLGAEGRPTSKLMVGRLSHWLEKLEDLE